MDAINGETLLFEAVDCLKMTTIELLLSKGVKVDKRLTSNGNTVSHELLDKYQGNKEIVIGILVLLAKFKANFEITNN